MLRFERVRIECPCTATAAGMQLEAPTLRTASIRKSTAKMQSSTSKALLNVPAGSRCGMSSASEMLLSKIKTRITRSNQGWHSTLCSCSRSQLSGPNSQQDRPVSRALGVTPRTWCALELPRRQSRAVANSAACSKTATVRKHRHAHPLVPQKARGASQFLQVQANKDASLCVSHTCAFAGPTFCCAAAPGVA